MIEWYKKVVFENYVNFQGRARRAEYWNFTLCNFLITLVLYIPIFLSIGTNPTEAPGAMFWIFYGLLMIYSLAVLLPSLGVAVRRLHDVGKSGWFLLLGLIPIVGGIILLVFMVTDSQPHENQWGKNPKNDFNELNDLGRTTY